MEQSKTRFEDTMFKKYLYPISEQCKKIYFVPAHLIDSEKLKIFLKDFSSITEDQKATLVAFLGIEVEEEFEFVELSISSTGKEEDKRKFHMCDILHTVTLESKYNFFYFDKGEYFSVQATHLKTALGNKCYDQQKRIVDRTLLQNITNNLDSENYIEKGNEFLTNSSIKSSSLSLSKILLTICPKLTMPEVGIITTYINTAVMASRFNAKEFQEVFELKGDAIVYFYNSKNYLDPNRGTLGGSCMRHDNNTEQIRFYASNPTNVSLLTYIKDRKLLARCVLWTDVYGQKHIDRLYCDVASNGSKIAAYCKSKGYSTIHEPTHETFGLEYSGSILVKVDTINLNKAALPYLDSIRFIDVVNNLVTNGYNILSKYIMDNKLDGCVTNISGGELNNYFEESYGSAIYVKGVKVSTKYVKSIKGELLKGRLSDYTIVSKPKVGFTRRDNALRINDNERVDATWCDTVLIKRYNSLVPTLTAKKTEKGFYYEVKLYDRQNIVFSDFHRMYIPITESIKIPSVKGYVLKNEIDMAVFKERIKLLNILRLYNRKLVRVSKDGLREIKEALNNLGIQENLSDLRRSRIFSLKEGNLTTKGALIKGILIPYKHLRIVKHESR